MSASHPSVPFRDRNHGEVGVVTEHDAGRVLSHPSGATYVAGSSAPDDAERMDCDRVGEVGHFSCGVHPCCGWPKFLVCPCDPRSADA